MNITPSLLISLLCLTSCDVPEIAQHLPATPAAWTSDAKQDVPLARPTQLAQWWKGFNDTTLDWLVTQALTNSPDVHQAAARIEEARGQQKSSLAALYPQVTANGGASRSRETYFAPMTGNSYNGTFDASYELDLFGKNSAASKAADVNTQATQADQDWIKLSMAAEVTRTYIALRAAEKQVLLAQKNLELQKSTLTLVDRQRKAGSSSNFDSARASLQVNQSTARIADYKRQKEIYTLSLMTLTGQTADVLRTHISPAHEIPGISLAPIADTPASVLAHRPDIRAANLRFSQATALKQSQAAAIFPSISLSGLFGISKSVLVSATNIWSVGANAAVSVLDFGRIQGQIDASSAREAVAYEQWRKAILQGLQDTETALTNVAYYQQQRVALTRSKDNAANAASLAQIRYRGGDSSLLDALDAQRERIQADSDLINAESNYATSIVALYKALGQY